MILTPVRFFTALVAIGLIALAHDGLLGLYLYALLVVPQLIRPWMEERDRVSAAMREFPDPEPIPESLWPRGIRYIDQLTPPTRKP